MVYVIRNNQQFGPYDDAALVNYVNTGKLLLCDSAKDDRTGAITSVRQYLRKNGLKVKIQHGGSLFSQVNRIGAELIFPRDAFTKNSIQSDTRLIILAIVGLLPTVFLFLSVDGYLLYYLVSLYFAIIWGLFFYYFFKTFQVHLKTTAAVFFLSQIAVFVIWDVLGIPAFNPFYKLADAAFPLSLLGFVLGVGLTEELVKALPLFLINRRSNQPLIPQTLVFYGLMSGIAFGVFEGVQYQIAVNVDLEYTTAYFHNILRLTSFPFIHATWCGIAGYFISFAALYPRYRLGLYFLSISVPALLHGIYDTFCDSLLGTVIALPVVFATVILLNAYLKQGIHYQSRLRN